jgi:hypothetical protein
MKVSVATVLLLVVPRFLVAQPAPSTHKPLVPMNPDELIKLLPGAPTGWTMTQSQANNYFIAWLCCQATREFQHPAPVDSSPQAKTAPPMITRVRIMDTGYFSTFNGDFENFRVGKYQGAETLVINGMPARKFFVGPNHEKLRLSVHGRFIVELETNNQPANSALSWLQIVDFKRLAGLPDSSPTNLPKPIHITRIDEMNPKNNATSDLFWSGPVSGDTDH